MIRRLALLLVLLSLPLAIAACGGDEEVKDTGALLEQLLMADEERAGALAEELGTLAQSDPALLDRLVAMFRLDEPNAGHVTLALKLSEPGAFKNDNERRAAARAVTEIMAFRLRTYGHPPGTFDIITDDGDIEVTVPKPPFPKELDEAKRTAFDTDYGKLLLRHLLAPAQVELLLVAAPPSKDAEPASLWTASAAAYDAFVKEKGAELDAAVEAGVVYAPKDTGFILCAIPPEDGTTEHGYLVAKRSANAAEHFDRDDFSLKPVAFAEAGAIGLEMTVAPDRREAMRAWTESHKGRELVLVVNGVAGSPMPIEQPIDGTILIPYGAQDDPAAAAALSGVLRALATKPFPYPLEGKRVRDVPPEAMTPAALALIASGNEGAKRMNQLRAEGGNLGARAARVLELIARRRTSGGERFVPGNK